MGGVRALATPTPWAARIEAHGMIGGEPASVFRSIFGIAEGATDGFDLKVDFLAPPPTPFGWAPAPYFFAASEPLSRLRELNTDVRGFPAVAAADIVWTLVVDAQAGFPPHVTDWHLTWDVSEIDAYWADVRMTSDDDGTDLDMRTTTTLPIALGAITTYTIRVRSVAIEIVAPSLAAAGERVVLDALVGGSIGTLTSATLYYARGGEPQYRSTPFAPAGGGVWKARIAASDITTRGLVWYAEMDDSQTGPQMTYTAEAPGSIPVAVATSLTLRATPGPQPVWNAVAPSIWPDIADVASTLDSADGGFLTEWFAWRWDASFQRWEAAGPLGDATPVTTDGFAPGQGWLVAVLGDVDETRQTVGQSVDATGPFEIPLSQGWNLLANPFAFPVAWSDATIAVDNGEILTPSQADSAGVTDNRIHYLDVASQSYVTRASDDAAPHPMQPGQAWWIYADGAGATLLIAPVAAE